jgi:predicted transglutaminase-like cysteine proteinase
MMEAEFEPEGYNYEDYEDYEDYGDCEDYGDYERECMVCAGYSYIKKINITPKKYNNIY